MKKYLTLLCAAAIAGSLGMSAAEFSYCNGVCNRTNSVPFRLGSSAKQGSAIKLSKEKLASLKGCTIKSISAGFGTSHINEGSLMMFITTDLSGTPITTQEATIKRALSWIDTTLDAPYTITGEEEALYIGYTAELDTKGTLLLGDKTASSEGTTYGLLDDQWVDLKDQGYGNPVLKFEVDECAPITDALLHPIDLDGYMKAGEEYEFSGYIYNWGTETINSFDVNIYYGAGPDPIIINVSDVDIPQWSSYEFKIDKFSSATPGKIDTKIEVSNINGVNDSDNSDNAFNASAYFYPKDMERNILLEGFTGMTCGNCPTGHTTINDFLSRNLPEPVIEVMHHAGYAPDVFTTEYDLEYTYLYGGSQTFAPAMMMNRTLVPGLEGTTVLNVSSSLLVDAYNYTANRQPYVSLDLQSTYDPDTRTIKLTFRSYAHNDLPSEFNALNVMLIENDIMGYPQSGAGSDYKHDAVTRDVLSGNAWGLLLNDASCVAGGEAVWECEYTIPEGYPAKYISGGENTLIPANPDNMYLVGYVSSAGPAAYDKFNVYNSVIVKVGEGHSQKGFTSGIADTAVDHNDMSIYSDGGKICVSGQYISLEVYDMAGMAVNHNCTLRPGIYIAKATNANHSIVKKILIK